MKFEVMPGLVLSSDVLDVTRMLLRSPHDLLLNAGEVFPVYEADDSRFRVSPSEVAQELVYLLHVLLGAVPPLALGHEDVGLLVAD